MVRSGVGGAGRRRDDCHFFNFDFSLLMSGSRGGWARATVAKMQISDGENADRTLALTMALTLSLTIRFADAKAAPFGLAKAHGGRDDGPRKSSDSNLLVPLRRRSTLSLRPRFDTPNACSVQAERSSQWRSSERDLPLSKRRSGVENET